jgi:hypothetical protein
VPLATKLNASHDRCGSNSEVGGRNREVRFTPESRLNSDIAACPFGANKRHRRSAFSFDDLVGAADERIWDGEAEGLGRLQTPGPKFVGPRLPRGPLRSMWNFLEFWIKKLWENFLRLPQTAIH